MEIEKKYRLTPDSAYDLESRLKEFGAVFTGEDDEENILFSNTELRSQKAVLRLRRIGARTVLTYKREQSPVGGAKRHLEHETEVADFDKTAAIFGELGYLPVLIYEKRRRKWELREVEVVIDKLPFGDFVEIEGTLTAILEVEMLLGADVFEVEERTYPVLTTVYGVREGELTVARFDSADEKK